MRWNDPIDETRVERVARYGIVGGGVVAIFGALVLLVDTRVGIGMFGVGAIVVVFSGFLYP
jgi:hypothetical protein